MLGGMRWEQDLFTFNDIVINRFLQFNIAKKVENAYN